MTHFGCKRIVVEVKRIMYGFLQRFNLAAIDVVTQVIPETPNEGYIRVGVFQPKEVFATYPSRIVLVLSVQSIDKEGRALPVKVVYREVLPLVREHGSVCHGTSATKEVVEVFPSGKQIDYPCSEFVLAAFVR